MRETMQRLALAILALALSNAAGAATIVISGSGPVADRTVNVPGCSKLTTGVNQAKESIGVVCQHVAGVPPLGAVSMPAPAPVPIPAPTPPQTMKGK
jgi:hypothetical protein